MDLCTRNTIVYKHTEINSLKNVRKFLYLYIFSPRYHVHGFASVIVGNLKKKKRHTWPSITCENFNITVLHHVHCKASKAGPQIEYYHFDQLLYFQQIDLICLITHSLQIDDIIAKENDWKGDQPYTNTSG